MDYYVVLGIAEDADDDAIRSAFRALARRYHPDVGAGSSSVEFQRAREAYETLVDPERRRRYDRQLRSARARPVVVREVIVSRPLFFDELVDELFASSTTNGSAHLADGDAIDRALARIPPKSLPRS